MNSKSRYLAALLASLLAIFGLHHSTSATVDLCSSEIIDQIQAGQSTKEDVKQLLGEPEEIKSATNNGEFNTGIGEPNAHIATAAIDIATAK